MSCRESRIWAMSASIANTWKARGYLDRTLDFGAWEGVHRSSAEGYGQPKRQSSRSIPTRCKYRGQATTHLCWHPPCSNSADSER